MSETNQSAALPDDFAAYESARDTPVDKTSEAAETPAESAEGSEPSTQEQEQAAEDADLQTPKGLKKRFSKLTKTIRELEAQLVAKATPAAPIEAKPAVATPEAAEEGKPKVESFETYDAYVLALSDWRFDQREKTRAAAETARKEQEARKTAGDQWREKEKSVKAAHEDYDEVMEDAQVPDTPARAAIHQVLVESEIGPELAYHLAKHPADMARIAALSPVRAVVELGKIEAALTPNPDNEKPKTSSAPKPPTPVGNKGAAPTKNIYDAKLAEDYESWERTRNAQLTRR